MARYLLRRVGQALLLLAGVSVLSFLLLDLAPGDFFDDARLDPRISPETVSALRTRYGLTQPLPQRYARWLVSAAHGDFGISFAYNLPAATLLWPRARNTLLLALPSLALAWGLALALGIWSAARPRSWIDRGTAVFSSLLLGIPDVVLASLVLLAAARAGWLAGGTSAAAARLGLPLLVLAAAALPVLLRHVRAAMREALDSACVVAARGHGVSETRLWVRHVLPLAANPLIALLGLSMAGLLSSSLLVEVIFGWPGLGPLLVEAIASRDVYLVLDPVMLSAVFLVAGNLLADLLLFAVDPKVRTE